jgi:hypothetical protein
VRANDLVIEAVRNEEARAKPVETQETKLDAR